MSIVDRKPLFQSWKGLEIERSGWSHTVIIFLMTTYCCSMANWFTNSVAALQDTEGKHANRVGSFWWDTVGTLWKCPGVAAQETADWVGWLVPWPSTHVCQLHCDWLWWFLCQRCAPVFCAFQWSCWHCLVMKSICTRISVGSVLDWLRLPGLQQRCKPSLVAVSHQGCERTTWGRLLFCPAVLRYVQSDRCHKTVWLDLKLHLAIKLKDDTTWKRNALLARQKN